jgi:hypothetical protein
MGGGGARASSGGGGARAAKDARDGRGARAAKYTLGDERRGCRAELGKGARQARRMTSGVH